MNYEIIKLGDHSIVNNLDKSSIVFDCGSCLGEFTYLSTKRFGCKVFAYEPNTRLYIKLKRKFKNNNKIIVSNLGIGGEVGVKTFYLGVGIENSSFDSTKRELSGITCEREMSTIPEEMKRYNLDYIDILKMDIEGAEIDVIYNLPDKVLGNIGQISMEYHVMSKIDGYTQETVDKCDNYILDKGFKRVTNPNIDRCYINEDYYD